MEQPTESGDVSIRNLGGLNQRASPLDLPLNEFSVLEGYYPSQAGLLSRLPGKEKLFQLEGRVLSIHPTYNSSGHVLIQTDEHLYLTTVDEIQGRTITTDLEVNPNPDPGGASSGDTTPPTDPTNLVASLVTQGTLQLDWTASFDAVAVAGYNVYSRISPSAFALLAITTTNTLAVTGLTASTAYDFYVEAFDAAGNISGVSNTATATTSAAGGDVTAPTAPTLLVAVTTAVSSVTLSWGASTDAVGVTGYIIYSRLGTSGSFTQAGTSVPTSFIVSGLAQNTAYDFQVKAFDAAGNISSASNTLSVTTLGEGSPPPITDELLIYYKTASGVDGTASTGSKTNYILTDVAIPNGKSSFLISNGFDSFQIPAGTYLLELWAQHFSTGTSVKFYSEVVFSSAQVSETVITPASDIIKSTHTLGVQTFPTTGSVTLKGYTSTVANAKLGKAVNLGELETHMILKVFKLL